MCLFLEVHIPNALPDTLDHLARSCDRTDLLAATPRTYSNITNCEVPPFLVLAATVNECGCSLLGGHHETPTCWTLRRTARGKLRRTLRALYRQTPAGLLFQSSWAGDPPTEARKVTLKEMLSIIWSGQIGKKTAYHVFQLAPPPVSNV